jgi:hypothetical protein
MQSGKGFFLTDVTYRESVKRQRYSILLHGFNHVRQVRGENHQVARTDLKPPRL